MSQEDIKYFERYAQILMVRGEESKTDNKRTKNVLCFCLFFWSLFGIFIVSINLNFATF